VPIDASAASVSALADSAHAAPILGDAAVLDHLRQPLALGHGDRLRARGVGDAGNVGCEHPQRAPHGVMAHDGSVVVERLRHGVDRGVRMRAIADRYTVAGSVECSATTESAIAATSSVSSLS
jgi:hypothetical protein